MPEIQRDQKLPLLIVKSRQKLVTRSRKRLEKQVEDRDEAIRDAIAAGISQSEISRACGLTRQTVHTIIRD